MTVVGLAVADASAMVALLDPTSATGRWAAAFAAHRSSHHASCRSRPAALRRQVAVS
jgi:hypothetical protein